MSRTRAIVGLLAGVLIVVSAAAHSLIGWSVQRAALETAGAGPDLVMGLAIGWRFGGVCMLLFGYIVLTTFINAVRGRTVALAHPWLIALMYQAFGAGALLVSKDPFFLVFIVPGLLLAYASR